MEQRSTWGNSPAVNRQKIEYVPTMRNSPKSTDAEKESVRLWNLMVNTLKENGLMKEKGE
ncbi:hypothetical protein [Paenibacillus macerans]|uniref:hypothetical protein n=1 Tax=Paenibacillus macerans TaxID=44252 RepID=UPI00203B53A7|nr:hypothetical protein [Paenibacillus macerans]MCM3703797.1 hypothetical protein [Paenibacillus macerans]